MTIESIELKEPKKLTRKDKVALGVAIAFIVGVFLLAFA